MASGYGNALDPSVTEVLMLWRSQRHLTFSIPEKHFKAGKHPEGQHYNYCHRMPAVTTIEEPNIQQRADETW